MLIGVPKEIKEMEFRVGLTPTACRALTNKGHTLLIERGLGEAISFSDEEYRKAGAVIATTAEAWSADWVIKVKEPLKVEWTYFRKELLLSCFLHLAAEPALCRALMESGCTAVAFETVEDAKGRLPLLMPMSAVAGRFSIQAGARALEMTNGGKGLLLGPAAGVSPAHVLIIGGGVSGTEALKVAIGMGATVSLLDRSEERLNEIRKEYQGKVEVYLSTEERLKSEIKRADLVIGAVLLPGKSAPKLLTREMLRTMEPGSAFVDISIDQGGICETSRPTTHKNPFYIEEGVVHYMVTNMPGAVAKTSSEALGKATLPYFEQIAELGFDKAALKDPGLAKGLNVRHGKIVSEAVASSLRL